MDRELYRVVLFFSILTLYSCNKEREVIAIPSNEVYKEYFPTSIGYWQEYQIDSFKYVKSPNDTGVTKLFSTSYYREEIGDTIKAFDTPYQLQIKAFRKKNINDNWLFYRNNSIQIQSNFITKNEDNLRFVKIQFPINPTTSWKGNKYIDTSIKTIYSDWNYGYVNLFQPYRLGINQFENTVTVIQYADSNAIEKTLFYEIYAKNVGLIYAEYQKLEKQNGANPWTLPENGYAIRKSIIDWKK